MSNDRKPWLHEPFQPGNPGSPGRPAGARNRLQGSFLMALADDFDQFGVGVIKIARIERPVDYLKIIASVLPKEFALGDAKLSELGDEEIAGLLATVRELKEQAAAVAKDADDEQSLH
jgi:hypothetical protein